MYEGFVYAIKEKMEQDGITAKELADICGIIKRRRTSDDGDFGSKRKESE